MYELNNSIIFCGFFLGVILNNFDNKRHPLKQAFLLWMDGYGIDNRNISVKVQLLRFSEKFRRWHKRQTHCFK